MALETYRRRRHFAVTPEPAGVSEPSAEARAARPFVIQLHDATRRHYDLRLELDGVLKSWAVPKGPSMDPGVKRLAVETEEHPIEYLAFEGLIPKGEYGAGPMLVWDSGVWVADGDAREGYAKGHLAFRLEGEKLRGRWHLVRTTPRADSAGAGRSAKAQWMLIKRRDAADDPLAPAVGDTSVLTGRDLDDVRRAGSEATLGDPATRRGVVKAALPAFVAPQLATLVATAPSGPGWVGEVKLDGYRLLARKAGAKVRLMTRRGLDWSGRYPEVARAVRDLPVRDALLDGEVVVLDRHGRSDFGALQRADARVVFFAFDLLHLDGWDLRAAALHERKELLRIVLAGRPSTTLRYGEHLVAPAETLLREVCALGLEGLVLKRPDAPYTSGRARTWLKLKCLMRQELVVVGFTEGLRQGLGALHLATRDAPAAPLTYAGKVGTGFSRATLTMLRRRLEPLRRDVAPVADAPRGGRTTHWVEPELVAEIAFSDWTRDGRLRHPRFLGLREDKLAEDIMRETPTAPPAVPRPPRARELTHIAGVRMTHPDRVMYPDLGITKEEVARYYERLAPLVLPYVAERPLSLLRCPDGVDGACFYQKQAHDGVPDIVPRVEVRADAAPYLMVKDLSGLLALVHFGVLELHTWGARADKLDRPDVLVFDLDPDPSVPWRRIAEAAARLADRLLTLGLVPFLRATGGKGLHVVVPLVRRSSWDEVKAFTHALALELVRAAPREFTARMAKRDRVGKIFIDYLRNAREATAIATWSPRARAGAPVASPLDWSELDAGAAGPPRMGLRDAFERAGAGLLTDPWRDFDASRRTLTRAMRDAVGAP